MRERLNVRLWVCHRLYRRRGISVTQLRQLMLEGLRRRNYAESTIYAYLRTVEPFAGFFHCLPTNWG